jgi:hypothetical protein
MMFVVAVHASHLYHGEANLAHSAVRIALVVLTLGKHHASRLARHWVAAPHCVRYHQMSAALNPGFSFDIASAAHQAPWELTGALAARAVAACHSSIVNAFGMSLFDHVFSCWCSGLVAAARDDPASRHGSTADSKVQRRLAAMAAGPPGKSRQEPAAPAPNSNKGLRARDTQTVSRDAKGVKGGVTLRAHSATDLYCTLSFQQVQTFPTGRHTGSKQSGHVDDIDVELPAQREDSSGASTSTDGDESPGACSRNWCANTMAAFVSFRFVSRVTATKCIKEQPKCNLASSTQVQTTCWTEMAVAQRHLHRRHLQRYVSR